MGHRPGRVATSAGGDLHNAASVGSGCDGANLDGHWDVLLHQATNSDGVVVLDGEQPVLPIHMRFHRGADSNDRAKEYLALKAPSVRMDLIKRRAGPKLGVGEPVGRRPQMRPNLVVREVLLL